MGRLSGRVRFTYFNGKLISEFPLQSDRLYSHKLLCNENIQRLVSVRA